MKTLAQWLAKIEVGHPSDIDMGLSRVNEVAKRLNIDLGRAVVITVAGTNGKGTTCALIEKVCLQAGLQVGVYSSPHLLQFNERIRVNAINASDSQICAAFENIERAKADTSITYFEYATLAALYAFQNASLDVVILEVGLGGRLDATNIIDADINVVTSIALDHQDYLGDTLTAIAREKMGIVKSDKLTVIGYEERYEDAERWLSSQHNQVLRLGEDFSYTFVDETYHGQLSISGRTIKYHWRASAIPTPNVMTAMASLHWLESCLPQDAARKLKRILDDENGMSSVIEQAVLIGRAQVIHRHPHVLLDVAHNEASAQYLCGKIGTFSFSNCHIVVGMLKDKNIEQTLASFSDIKAHWYCASLPTARGEAFQRLVRSVPAENSASVCGFESVDDALASAVNQATKTDMIVVLGSFVTVAQAMRFFRLYPMDE